MLPKVLLIERPKKDDAVDESDEEAPDAVLLDVPPEVDKFLGYGKRFSADYDIPALPAFGGTPPLPLPLPGADDDLFGGGAVAGAVVNDASPTFDKQSHEMEKTIEDARFIAQHVKNKDKFESVSL